MKEVEPARQPARLVVLASGMGSRLRSKTSPKPLVEPAGISPVGDCQIRGVTGLA